MIKIIEAFYHILCVLSPPLCLPNCVNDLDPSQTSNRKGLQFHGNSYGDPVGRSGGLALWWKDEVDLEVCCKSKNIFRFIVTWPKNLNSWLSTFVYAPSLL